MTKERDPFHVSIGFRLPLALRDKLQQLAGVEKRSLNGEVIHRLTQSVWPRPTNEVSEVLELLDLSKGPAAAQQQYLYRRQASPHATYALRGCCSPHAQTL